MVNEKQTGKRRMTAVDAARSFVHKRPEPNTDPPTKRPESEISGAEKDE